MRLVKLAIGLVILLLLPFLLWGRGVEDLFTIDGTISWLRGFGGWGIAVAVLLLASDILLPIPATLVMTALGMLYGPVVGGLIGAGGSFLGGMIAFLACAKLGRPAARHFVSAAELVRGETLFERWGAWIIVLSRWLPIIPEAVSCMAGIVSMPRRLFYWRSRLRSYPSCLYFCYCRSSGRGASRPDISAERFSARGVLAGSTPENAPGNIHELNLTAP